MRDRLACLTFALAACTPPPTPLSPDLVCLPTQPAKSVTSLVWFASSWMDCDDVLTCTVGFGDASIDLLVQGRDPSPPWESSECLALRYVSARCAIPRMPEGTRTVTLNGAKVGEVTFTPDGVESCDAPATSDFPMLATRCTPGIVPPNTPFRIRTRLSNALRADDTCLDSATCHVTTDAGRIDLTHTLTYVPGKCAPTTVDAVCEVPGLIAGAYRVFIDGALETDPLVVGNGTETDCTLAP